MAHDLKESDLGRFTGSETCFRHGLVKHILLTEGAMHVAEHGGAYWLLDKIATNQMLPEIKQEGFQVWKLKVNLAKNTAVLLCDDGNDHTVFHENITYTDFPLQEISLWFSNNVILLPSEY